jgi:acetate kinase
MHPKVRSKIYIRGGTQGAMMKILTLNPGGNSLKIELVECRESQQYAFEGSKLFSITIEDIGKTPTLSIFQGKEATSKEPVEAEDYEAAMRAFFKWHEEHSGVDSASLEGVDCVGVRVVHGGVYFDKPTPVDAAVEERIVMLEKLAPLHNKSSIEILGPLKKKLSKTPVYAVFDTAFHRTLPEHAYTYAIPPELAKKHGIRRYGFHGISHRYLLERYASLAGKEVADCNVVSMHLESGCSVSAIKAGKSIDNTMGMTPLEGLMMGTRSGDIDPSLISILMREEGMKIDEVMTLLNKKSGLLGISGESLDTRVLMKSYGTSAPATLAMDMFAYRVRKAVGAHIAALGEVSAVIFGGGIAEDTPFVRERVCEGLKALGLEEDREVNHGLINREGKISRDGSAIEGWVIMTEEGLQIANECLKAHQNG